MIELGNHQFRSKVFSRGNFTKTLDLAVRGAPRKCLPAERLVDHQCAFECYLPEISVLDTLEIRPEIFTCGITAAALIRLALNPQSRAFWQALNERIACHDGRGHDTVGLLLDLIERHMGDMRMTLRPDYQWFLFQAALALSDAWLDDERQNRRGRYRRIPEVPDTPELLQQVRKAKSLRHSPGGFRRPVVLRRVWREYRASRVLHRPDPRKVIDLMRGANSLEGRRTPDHELGAAANWAMGLKLPAELRHPAALAAAAKVFAGDPGSRRVWEELARGQWMRDPDQRLDCAGMLRQCIRKANVARDPLAGAVVLHERCIAALSRWRVLQRDGEPFRLMRAPQARGHHALAAVWAAINLTLVPEIRFGETVEPFSKAPYVKRRKSDRKSSTRQTEHRQATGLQAEEWVMANYRSLHPELAGTLEDHRLKGRGYDFLIRGTRPLFLEVKGIPAEGGAISILDSQWDKARREGKRYFLVIVSNLCGHPEAQVIRDPARVLPAQRTEITQTRVEWRVDATTLRRTRNES